MPGLWTVIRTSKFPSCQSPSLCDEAGDKGKGQTYHSTFSHSAQPDQVWWRVCVCPRGANTQGSPATPRGGPISTTASEGPGASSGAGCRVQSQGSYVTHSLGTSQCGGANRFHYVLGRSRKEHVVAHSAPSRRRRTVSERGDDARPRRFGWTFTRTDAAHNALRRQL